MGSPMFEAQLQRWSNPSAGVEGDGGDASAQGKGRKRTAPPEAGSASSPELLVHLRTEDERPAAEAAIKFIYTDDLELAGMGCAELLRVRRQASYLQVEGCVAACDTALLELVRTDGAAALELHRCEDLFPQPDEEASGFAAVLEAAKPKLLRGLLADFSSAPAVLNSQQLRERFEQLPAGAVEALLESDDLATDDESSVLLLLLSWRTANASVATETYERLCRLVRAVHLSDSYLGFVLPEIIEPSSFGFPMSHKELRFVRESKAAGGGGCFVDVACTKYSGKTTRWYAGPRAQAIPTAGLTFDWHIPRQELADAVKKLAAAESQTASRWLNASLALPSDASSSKRVCARGWEWRVVLSLQTGKAAAGLHLIHHTPKCLGGLDMAGALVPLARLAAHRWQGVAKAGRPNIDYGRHVAIGIGSGRGLPEALPLRCPLPAGPSAGAGDAAATAAPSSADQLGSTFDDWLHEGKLSGTLVFRRE